MELFVTDQKTLEDDGWLPGPYQIEDDQDEAPKIRKSAERYIETLLEFNPDATEQLDLRDRHLTTMEQLGEKARKGSLQVIGEIRHHFPVIEKQLDKGSWLYGNFTDIENLSRSLNPQLNQVSDEPIPRLVDKILFFRATPVKRHLSQFESRRNDAVRLADALVKTADVFEKDIELFKSQIRTLGEFCTSLGRNIYLGRAIEDNLARALEHDVLPEDPRREFIETEQIPRVRKRVTGLKHQLQLNRAFITALTVALLNTETLYKALKRLNSDLVSAFSMGIAMARERFGMTMEPLAGEEPPPSDNPISAPLPLTALTAAFSRITELTSSAKAFMPLSLEAFKAASAGLPEFQKKVEEAFKGKQPVDLDITQEHVRGV